MYKVAGLLKTFKLGCAADSRRVAQLKDEERPGAERCPQADMFPSSQREGTSFGDAAE